MIIGKSQGIGDVADGEIGVRKKKIGALNFLTENIVFEADAGKFFEIPGQVLVIVAEMAGNGGNLQIVIDVVVDVINDVVV